MTPEALSKYLHTYRDGRQTKLDPDAIQAVLLDYLTWPVPIRHPKVWAWRRVHWKMIDEHRQRTLYGSTRPLGPEEVASLVSTAPNPLTRAEQRQKLTRFAEVMAKASPKRWHLWRQRGV